MQYCESSMVTMMKKCVIILTAAAAFAGCALPNMSAFLGDENLESILARSANYREIVKTDSVIVLRWDAPAAPMAGYNVY